MKRKADQDDIQQNNKKPKCNIFYKGIKRVLKLGPDIYKDNLHRLGYTVLKIEGPYTTKDSYHFTQDTINKIKNYAAKHDSYIFNNKSQDFKRRQCNLKNLINKKEEDKEDKEDKDVKNITSQIENTIKTFINPDLNFNSWVILRSLAGCSEQEPHTDYVPTKDLCEAVKNNNKVPLLCLVALEDDTKINVWPRSIKLITQNIMKNTQKINKKVINLDKNQMIVFRADLIHAGAEYKDKDNIRLHCFADSKYVKRDANRTYIIRKHASQALQDKIKI